MLEGIFNFFQWFADLISIAFDLIVNFFSSLINFFKIIPSVLTFVFSSISFLPDVVMIFATFSVTIAVVLLIIGRSNN